jgi:thiamine pyrophosphokinase
MTEFQSFIGQQISLFAANPEIEITSTRLKYNLNKIALNSLYCGSLNESSGDTFTLSISHGKILVYQVFE